MTVKRQLKQGDLFTLSTNNDVCSSIKDENDKHIIDHFFTPSDICIVIDVFVSKDTYWGYSTRMKFLFDSKIMHTFEADGELIQD